MTIPLTPRSGDLFEVWKSFWKKFVKACLLQYFSQTQNCTNLIRKKFGETVPFMVFFPPDKGAWKYSVLRRWKEDFPIQYNNRENVWKWLPFTEIFLYEKFDCSRS